MAHRQLVAHADVAQLVAHHLAKVRVAGSSPVIRSGFTFARRIPRGAAGGDSRGGNATVEWLSGLGNGLQNRVHGFDSRFHLVSRAFSSAGERFPDTEEVTGSIPVSRTNRRSMTVRSADVAQLVAHHLAKVRVAGSSPVIRSTFPSGGTPARLAQRESASLTRKRSLVRSQYRAQSGRAPRVRPGGGCSAGGRASPCHGEGRGVASRHPLHSPGRHPTVPACRTSGAPPAHLRQGGATRSPDSPRLHSHS